MSASPHSLDPRIAALRQQVHDAETQLRGLQAQLQEAEQHVEAARNLDLAYHGGVPPLWIHETLTALQQDDRGSDTRIPQHHQRGRLPEQLPRDAAPLPPQDGGAGEAGRWPLHSAEYRRYGRQLIMPEVGLHGQLRLRHARVLVVGVGGLGCPAAAYLAGAGVGTLGLVDGDTVEASNLHRQVAHATSRVGMSKVESAWHYLQDLNPLVTYRRHNAHLTPQTAISLFSDYDLVLDCTDHPTSRYLISDACVLTNTPLVSASALKTEGQLIVLNNPARLQGDPAGGPCYRCIFPRPPPAESVLSCGEGGILGPVVGVMGVLQALEAIKVLTAKRQSSSTDVTMNGGGLPDSAEQSVKPSLLMFSAYSAQPFRSVRMRSRRADCAACSSKATITTQSLTSGSLDYVAFCGATAPVNGLDSDQRVSASEFARLPQDGSNMLIDVRDETQYAIAALRGSINVPWTGSAESWLGRVRESRVLDDFGSSDCYVVCRLGNDSQLAARALLDEADGTAHAGRVKDIRGGFQSWRREVDPEWPDY